MAGGHTWLVDYGLGNLLSVGKALEKAGGRVRTGSDPALGRNARAIVLPGVGAFDTAARNLREKGLDGPLREHLARGRPFLGICLGFQLLFEKSGEGRERGLGFVAGEIRRLPGTVKVPHIGWNRVVPVRPSRLLENLPGEPFFYFVHSYYGICREAVAETSHGTTFAAALEKGPVCATQFHPEKSGDQGIRLLANFLALAGD